jgi:uncharacterized membrane-anchored protein
MKARPKLVFLGIVLFQLLILLGLVSFNEAILAFGKTVVLQTAPVDPRDIFRGDYVVLRYEISTLSDIPMLRTVKEGDKAYVRLEQRGDVWEATEISKVPREEWAVFISGKVTRVRDIRITMEYGIEAYFVPEGEGREIERAQDIKVRVSLDRSGKATIKGLIIDGAPFQLR